MKYLNSQPLNAIVIGSGHYVCGETTLTGLKETDKDFGVILPSLLYLRQNLRIREIFVVGQNGNKFRRIRDKIRTWEKEMGWDVSLNTFPEADVNDSKAYLYALERIPRPAVALIALPDHLHYEVMLACIEQKIPFLVVKPAVIRLKEFYTLKKKLQESKVFAMVDYHKVYDEVNLSLLQDILENKYGIIYHMNSLMTQRRDMLSVYERWFRENPQYNVNHYLGSHYIHLTGFLTKAIPLTVRATAQKGFAEKKYRAPIADTIQTHIIWHSPEGYNFSSYHIAGWNDPEKTEAMTYQELHILCENGHIFSDQKYRGTRKILNDIDISVPNPYFFNFTQKLVGGWNLPLKYGYQSIEQFITLVQNPTLQAECLRLPTFEESESVTAILEAADLSLAEDSRIVKIKRSTQSEFEIF